MNKKSFLSLIEAIKSADVICHDYETQSDAGGKAGNMEYWHPHSRIVSGSFTTAEAGTFVIPLSHPEGPFAKDRRWAQVLRKIAQVIENHRLKLVAHNAKYEVAWVYWMTGVKLENLTWWDTMMSSYVLDENEPNNLKDVAHAELGVDKWDEVNLKDAEKVPWDNLALYNARDTDYCLRLQPIHKERLLSEPRLARLFHFHSMPLVRTLARIERVGMPLDRQRAKEMAAESRDIVVAEQDYLLAIAEGEYGMDLENYPTISFTGATSKFFKEFMVQTELPEIKKTATGNPSWDQYVLEELERQGYKIAEHILNVRRHGNRLSKFFVPWETKLAPDGRIHAQFNPMRVDDKWSDPKGTTTGRLSSSNPNLQQVNRDLKICFGGEEEWLFAELDYSQIELRLMAWIANIENVLQAYYRGEDLHKIMASNITGKPLDKITKDERQGGKAGNFGFAYDMSETTYIEYAKNTYGVEVGLEEATNVRRAFFDKTWIGLARWHDQQRNIAYRQGFVRNPLGRRRRLPEIFEGHGYEVGRAERRAINAPIQSMAADLMSLALIEIDRQLPADRIRLVGTVHDSLLAQVRPDSVDESLQQAAGIMLDPGTEKKFGVKVEVPLEVEAKIGYNWDDPEAEVRVYRTH